MISPLDKAREIGGQRLVRFFDAILAEQRKRWNAPDWRDTPPTDDDITNWQDVSTALASMSDSSLGALCDHAGWSFEKYGRRCHRCGAYVVDYGD